MSFLQSILPGCITFFLITTGLTADTLSSSARNSTLRSMERMLAYHVEQKEFSPLLCKRTIKLLFDQFDPNHIYLLEKEVSEFIDMPEEMIRKTVSEYHMGRFTTFERIDSVIRKAILRSQAYRKGIREKFLTEERLSSGSDVLLDTFPKNEQEMTEKLLYFFTHWIEIEKQAENLKNLTFSEREKLVQLLESRLVKSENDRLLNNGGMNLSGAILKAFAKSLDAHTAFFTPEEAAELRTNLEKQFEGIGIVFQEGIRGISVKTLVKGGPADKTGKIRPGDLLIAVDGRSTEDLPYGEVMTLIKKAKGKNLSLTFRSSNGEGIAVTLQKEKIILQEERLQYTSIPHENGILGILRLPSFYENSDGISAERDIKNALRELRKQGNLLGLLVDVRDNTGGFLTQAVKVAGLFMSSGVVVISKYANNRVQYLREVDGKMFYSGPLLLLTSKLSASATEIVAQALQDYGIALIAGDDRTYGKGSIQYQTVTEETAPSYFKVTIGKYYTVSGKSTQIEGVKADLSVPTKYASFNIGEKYLLYPLKNDRVASAFLDRCHDIEDDKLPWFEKNYLPNLQKKLSCWTAILPDLQKNSKNRIRTNEEYQIFLQTLENKPSLSELREGGSLYGKEDLQLKESLSILMDMTSFQVNREKNFSRQ